MAPRPRTGLLVRPIQDAGGRRAIAAPRGSQPRFYDGVAELWWDSLDDLTAVFSTDVGQAAAQELLEDELRFIDLPRSPLWLGEENVVFGAA